jgi:isopenicillin-N epimerase
MTVLGRGLLEKFGLEPGTHLNHAGYGGMPLPLRATQDGIRARIEANPTRFFRHELGPRLREAASVLAPFVGTAAKRLAFVTNATEGVNAVLNSLRFNAGDVLLTTDHVYGAVRHTMRYMAARWGASVIEAPVAMPVAADDAVLSAVEAAWSDRVKLLVIDHVVSASAVVFPVAALVRFAHARGVPVLVDGAHTPGMLDLDIDAIGADWYVGNCHKWLCSPKGAGFIAVAPNAPEIHPTVISHAYGQGFVAEFDKTGTRDPSAALCVPDAIAFHQALGGAALRARNVALARTQAATLARAFNTDMGAAERMLGAIATVRMPNQPADWALAQKLSQALSDRHRITVPFMAVGGALWLRISAFAYNEDADYARLPEALQDVLGAT